MNICFSSESIGHQQIPPTCNIGEGEHIDIVQAELQPEEQGGGGWVRRHGDGDFRRAVGGEERQQAGQTEGTGLRHLHLQPLQTGLHTQTLGRAGRLRFTTATLFQSHEMGLEIN